MSLKDDNAPEGHLKGLAPRVIVSKYAENTFTDKEVVANVKISDKFGLHFQGH